MNEEESREFQDFNTFGANYYDLLRKGFFLENNAIGGFATHVIESIIKEIDVGLMLPDIEHRIDKIADPLIKGFLMYKLEEKRKELDVQNKL